MLCKRIMYTFIVRTDVLACEGCPPLRLHHVAANEMKARTECSTCIVSQLLCVQNSRLQRSALTEQRTAAYTPTAVLKRGLRRRRHLEQASPVFVGKNYVIF